MHQNFQMKILIAGKLQLVSLLFSFLRFFVNSNFLSCSLIFFILLQIAFLQVTFTEEHVSFLHFLTNVCAIVGGSIYDLIPFVFSHALLALK